MDEEGWERYDLHGKKVYQLDICEAIHDHHLCPGVTAFCKDVAIGTSIIGVLRIKALDSCSVSTR